MGDSASWWASKMGRPAPPPPQHVPGYPMARQAPQYPPQQAPYAPPGYAPPPQAYVPPGYPQQAEIPVLQAVHIWNGTPAAQAEQSLCPNCGDDKYFSRTQPEMSKINEKGQSVSPPPLCYSCGYNGRYAPGDAFADAYASQ